MVSGEPYEVAIFKRQKWLNISNFIGFDLKAAEIHDC